MTGIPEQSVVDDESSVPARRRWLAEAAALGTVIALVLAGILARSTPAPRPADAPAGEFSAERAMHHVRQIATEPHPVGSRANDRVRDYLVNTLRGLGLSPEIQDATGQAVKRKTGRSPDFARVRNVIAVIPGSRPSGRVFFTAHYDSVTSGPGASDDGMGVAALLETARALRDTKPRNDIVLLFTDGEEVGLTGAEAFVSRHPLGSTGGVVYNLEGSGPVGPVLTFQSSANSAGVIRAYQAAPAPVADSAFVTFYELGTHGSDFTVFRQAGFTGLDSANVDGRTYYHTALDDVAHLDPGTVQHHGDNALAMARILGAADLTDITRPGSASYFTLPGLLVSYPSWLVWPLAIAALLAALALAFTMRRKGLASAPRIVAGIALTVVPFGLAYGVFEGMWSMTTAVRPELDGLTHGEPYHPTPLRLAVLVAAAAVVMLWYALLRRRIGPSALAVGALLAVSLMGVATAALVPGAAHLLTIPPLFAAVGGLVALAVRGRRSIWPLVAITAGLVPAALLLGVTAWFMCTVGLLEYGGYAALFTVAFVVFLLPLVELVFPPRPRLWRAALVPAVAGGVAIALLVTGIAVNGFDAEHPVHGSLAYGLDADDSTAVWMNLDGLPNPWSDQLAGDRGSEVPERFFPASAVDREEVLSGPAEPARLAAPALEVVADQAGGATRTVTLRLRSPRLAPTIELHVDGRTAEVRGGTCAGRVITGNQPGDQGSFRTRMFGLPDGGVEVTLELAPRGGGPVRVRLIDTSYALDGLPGYRPPPPGILATHQEVKVAKTFPL